MNGECPRCREYAEEGQPFCGVCGRQLTDAADDMEREPAVCGNDPDEGISKPVSAQRRMIETFLLAACVAVMAIAVFEAIVLAINIPDIFSFLSGMFFRFFLLLPGTPVVFSLRDLALQMYWLFVAIVILLCVALTIKKFICAIRSAESTDKFRAAENTAAFWVFILLTVSLLISYIIIYTVLLTGNDITTPSFGGKRMMMYLFAEAAFREELVTRVLFIGVPMVILSLIITKKKESFKCLLGGFEMSIAAFVLIMISAAIFGLAHYSGWDGQEWKVLQTGVMGVSLGYVFVRFGLYASILLHFIVNYLSAFDWIGAGTFSGIVEWLLVGIGVVALIYMVMRLSDFKRSNASLPLFGNRHTDER